MAAIYGTRSEKTRSAWGGRAARSGVLLLVIFALNRPLPAEAQGSCATCPGAITLNAFVCADPGTIETGTAACFPGAPSFRNCQKPTLVSKGVVVVPQGPGLFEARLSVKLETPYNSNASIPGNQKVDLFWKTGSPADPSLDLCENNLTDVTTTYLSQPNLSCAGAPYDFGTYSLRAMVCRGGGACQQFEDAANLPFKVTPRHLKCIEPPLFGCNGDAACTTCLNLGQGNGGCGASFSPAGEGASITPCGGGPGATPRYRAGGAGGPNLPGTAAWNPSLGRFWSHDYAQRIVPDPPGSTTHAWLITPHGTFREYRDTNSDGTYETILPSDEYRPLVRLGGGGWELRELDGGKHTFNSNGLWLETRDKNNNAKLATYSGGNLTGVTFPDGRREELAYVSGRLQSITLHPVIGTPDAPRTWTYDWSGLDLFRITRPDGSAWEFFYSTDPDLAGYVTRMDLVGSDHLSRRIEAAFEYDSRGNVAKAWRGDPFFAGPNAVDTWSLTYDDVALPTVTQATDGLGLVTTYRFERDRTGSNKPKVLQIDGDCPTCGTAPNARFDYTDASHPLLPTVSLDGRNLRTEWSYNALGRMTAHREAVGTSLQRETFYSYSPVFPDFVTSMDRPSASGGAARAISSTTFNGTGDAIERTIQGAESGGAFLLTTFSQFNPQGQPLTINPPGYGSADVTTLTYAVPNRNGLVPDSRTEPLVGLTLLGYDGFNRRTSMTDPNGVVATTTFDPLDRVLVARVVGDPAAVPPVADLVTTSTYTTFGDLLRTTLPAGNVIEYGYDGAGRLRSVERKPDAATPKERTLYTLDKVGHRIREDFERWDGTAWVTEGFRSFVYSTRCHLDRAVLADGSSTEYRYDCSGNLEKMWDANHPSVSNPLPTHSYAYDALNRLITMTQPWAGAGGGFAVTSYDYDRLDHLSKVTDANGNMTTYTTSDRDLLTAETSVVSGSTVRTYNDHGEQVTETDARGVTATRVVDAADRVTSITYPDSALNTTFTYDDPLVTFSKGRLTKIARPGTSVDYRYDRFGRTTQDGSMSYTLDPNGNRIVSTYPNGVEALATYDFADRPLTLSLRDGAGTPQALANAAIYKPFGPLASLSLGNGLAETRAFDSRYYPQSIAVPGRFGWTYTVDKLGHPLAIADSVDSAGSRSFSYQDHHYFLTGGNGPWGVRTYTYDRIGNRLNDTGIPYTYFLNGTGGNTPKIETRVGRSFEYDLAGDITLQGKLGMSYDAARDLSGLVGSRTLSVLSDGRGFLRRLFNTSTLASVEPTYGSEGMLYHRKNQSAGTTQDTSVLYFAGRPLALYEKYSSGTNRLVYLTTDHLGTPALATGSTGSLIWRGGFEPFGADYSAAQDFGVFLRFPGQWSDNLWSGLASKHGELYYNVNRWYDTVTGRYTAPDPLGLADGINSYLYSKNRPLEFIDPTGLQASLEGQIPTLDEVEEMTQRDCARKAFYRNYGDMVAANWKFSDKYFHCKANCEAARCGKRGFDEACGLSDLREFVDQNFKGDPPSASAADQVANRFGRRQAVLQPRDSCKMICARFRPTGLPGQY